MLRCVKTGSRGLSRGEGGKIAQKELSSFKEEAKEVQHVSHSWSPAGRGQLPVVRPAALTRGTA